MRYRIWPLAVWWKRNFGQHRNETLAQRPKLMAIVKRVFRQRHQAYSKFTLSVINLEFFCALSK